VKPQLDGDVMKNQKLSYGGLIVYYIVIG
jgi:hypothetical protein